MSPLGVAPASYHIMGTSRMGDDPATSVVGPEGRLWDVDNVLVVDSSVFPTSAGYNPTLTIMAMAGPHRPAPPRRPAPPDRPPPLTAVPVPSAAPEAAREGPVRRSAGLAQRRETRLRKLRSTTSE